MTTFVVLLVLVLFVAGCGTPPDPRLIPRASLADLEPVLVRRIQADGTEHSQDTFRITLGTTVVTDAIGSTSSKLGPGGPAVSSTTTLSGPAEIAGTVREIVLPDAAYLGPPHDPAPPGKDWAKLDATPRSPYYEGVQSLVRMYRETGTRLFCLTEIGGATLTGSRQDELDGVPVLVYSMHIDLERRADDELTASLLRELGLSSVDSTMAVDADDRVRQCHLDQPLPDGAGSVLSDQRFDGFGAPVEVAAPPPDRVVAVPAG
jgi:hypothetical protein